MRTIKVKLGSLRNLISITTDAKTFGEFHEELEEQSGELFDLDQIDVTKFDFVDMNTKAVYGQVDNAELPLNDCCLLVVPRNNKGASDDPHTNNTKSNRRAGRNTTKIPSGNISKYYMTGEPPKAPVLAPDCTNCLYKKHVEEEVINAEFAKEEFLRNRR